MAQVSYSDIAQVVVGMLEASPQADVAQALADYLLAERRASELDKIMREVSRIREREHGIIEVTAESRYPLTAELKQQIEALFAGKKTIINEDIHDDLVGGVKIQAGDTLIDLSVRGQLNKLKAHRF